MYGNRLHTHHSTRFYLFHTKCDFRRILPIGIYNVTVTDDNGCNRIDSITVEGFDAIQLDSISTPVTCFGDSDGTATVIVVDSISNYIYEWSHDDTLTSSTASNLPADTYNVTVTDSSCFGDSNGTVSVMNVSGGNGGYTYE